MNEEWRDVENYEGYYQVSNKGRIKSLIGWNGNKYVKREKILSPYVQTAKGNYKRSVIKLIKNKKPKDEKVHRIVAKAFLPNPNNLPLINHKDGNPFNNNVENLEWCTQKYNVHHAIEHGLMVQRIHLIDRETMVELLNSGYTYDEISEILDIAKGTVFNYIKRFKIKKIYV